MNIEGRIGQLLGPAINGGDRRSDQFLREGTENSALVDKNARYDYRYIARALDGVRRLIRWHVVVLAPF